MGFPQGPSEAQSTIERWLKEEGLDYSQATGEMARNTLFNYIVTLPSGITIQIIQSSSSKDCITVSKGVKFTAEQMKAFRQKTQIERKEILDEMRFGLASVDVEFAFMDGELPKAIRIDHAIYYDALTKDRFFKAISIVFRAFCIGGWIVKKTL